MFMRLFLLLSVVLGCKAVSNAATISLDVLTTPAGTQAIMPVRVTGASNIVAADFQLTFDPELLQVAAVTGDSSLPGWSFSAGTNVPGTVKISLMGLTATTSQTGFAYVTFMVATNAPIGRVIPVSLTLAKIYDADGLVSATVQNGSIRVTDMSPPAPVTGLTAFDTPNDGGGSISLVWTKSADDGGGDNDVVSYEVWRSQTSGASFGLIATVPAGTQQYSDNIINSASPPANGVPYYYVVKTRDGFNTTSSQQVGPVSATMIQALISSPASNAWVGGQLDILGSAYALADFDSYYLSWAPGANPASGWRYLPVRIVGVTNGVLHAGGIDTRQLFPVDGVYTIRLTVSDFWGDSAESTSVFSVDNTSPATPAITLSAPMGQAVYVKDGDRLSIQGSTEPYASLVSANLVDENGTSFMDVLGNLSVATASGSITGSVVVANFGARASVQVKAAVRDRAGNSSGTGGSGWLLIDNRQPSISITSIATNNNFTFSPILIGGTFSNAITPVMAVEVSTDNGINYNPATITASNLWSFNFTPDQAMRSYIVKARAIDLLGRVGVCSNSVRIYYFPSYPAANVASPVDGMDLGEQGTLPIVGTVLNDSGNSPGFGWVVDYSRNGGSWTNIAGGNQQITNGLIGSWNHHSYLPNGTYTLRLTATNNSSSSACTRVLTNWVAAPTAPLLASPASNALDVATGTGLDWNPVPRAGYYDVYLWPVGSNKPSAPTASVISNSYQVSGLAIAQAYNWQVVARNGAGTNASPTWTFFTAGFPVARIDTPVDGPLGGYPMMSVTGTAFSSLGGQIQWTLSVAPGNNPSGGWSDLYAGNIPVSSALLAQCPRPTVPGTYTLRLQVTVGSAKATAMRVLTLPEPRAVLVDQRNASGTRDGYTWATAFTNIQSGVNAAGAFSGQVWVAEGTFRERVLCTNLALYGAFAGTETLQSQRRLDLHETIIDAQYLGSPLIITNGASVDGFTLRGATNTIGGSNATFTSCKIMGNSGNPLLEAVAMKNCLIAKNLSPVSGVWRLFNKPERVSELTHLSVVDRSIQLNLNPASDPAWWTPVTNVVPPPPRDFSAMAYDNRRGQTVLFGGVDSFYLNDTWEYDGASWTSVKNAVSPSVRYGSAMAYDGRRGKIALFGGYANGFRNDTWEYDGTNWISVTSVATPSARVGSRMAYDSRRGKIVLFGGEGNGGYPNDTWEYDGTNWTSVTSAVSPLARTFPAMAYDSRRGKIVLFGGSRYGDTLNDTWEYDGGSWTLVTSAVSPSARYCSTMAYDSRRGKIVLFGGVNSLYLNDTWEYDGTNWISVTSVATPSAREGSGMVYDSRRGKIVLFGGQGDGSYHNDTWEYSAQVVHKVQNSVLLCAVPASSLGVSSVLDATTQLTGDCFAEPFTRGNGAVSNDWKQINASSGDFNIMSNQLKLVDNLEAGDPQLSHALAATYRLWLSLTMTVASGGTYPEPFVKITGGGQVLATVKCVTNQLYYGTAGGWTNSGIIVQRDQAVPLLFDVDCDKGVFSLAVSNTLVCSRLPLYQSNAVADAVVLGATGYNHSGVFYWDDVLVDVPSSGNMIADPMFVNPAAGDFRLQLKSPAIDAGTAISGLTNDIVGTPRPFGAGYDIGCYESIAQAPAITLQPLSVTTNAGASVSFSVSASGTAPLTYQWYFNTSPVVQGTGATLALPAVTISQAGTYGVVVSNAFGLTNSAAATLTVMNGPLWIDSLAGGFVLSNGVPRLRLSGLAGQGSIIVYASTNLVDWPPIWTGGPVAGTLEFWDTNAASFPRRFYRATEAR